MFAIEFGRTCEVCYDQKPDVRYARDVRKHLCNCCWAATAPPQGGPRSGLPNRPPPSRCDS